MLCSLIRYTAPALFLLAATGCGILYRPVAVHVPDLQQQKDGQISAYTGDPVDIAASYAITDKIAVMATGSIDTRDYEDTDTSFNSHRHLYGELAVGLYKRHEWLNAGIFAGVGYGYAEARWSETSSWWNTTDDEQNPASQYLDKGNYMRMFLHGYLGAEGDVLGAGVVSRPTYLQFFNLKEEENGIPYTSSGVAGTFLLETTFYARIGTPDFKIEGQLTYALRNPFSRALRFNYLFINTSIGVSLIL